MPQLCPRCGSPGSLTLETRAGRSYYYFQHKIKVGSRISTRKCYLGPRDYAQVSRFQPMVLQGMIQPGRLLDYLRGILDALPAQLGKLDAEQLESILEQMLELVRGYRKAKAELEPGSEA